MKYLSRNAEKANGTVPEFSIYMRRSADITVTSEESEFNRILCKTNKQTNVKAVQELVPIRKIAVPVEK